MSFCRPVSELEILGVEWIPAEIMKIVKGYTMDEFLLEMRNGSLEASINSDDSYSEVERIRLMDAIEDVKEVLLVNGFFRPDMMITTPELYFVVEYIVKPGLTDDYQETFLPYFSSNEDYEQYVFCYERIEAIINLLANFLTQEGLYEVAMDIMYTGDDYCDKEILEDAKGVLFKEREKIVPLLEQAFSMY